MHQFGSHSSHAVCSLTKIAIMKNPAQKMAAKCSQFFQKADREKAPCDKT